MAVLPAPPIPTRAQTPLPPPRHHSQTRSNSRRSCQSRARASRWTKQIGRMGYSAALAKIVSDFRSERGQAFTIRTARLLGLGYQTLCWLLCQRHNMLGSFRLSLAVEPYTLQKRRNDEPYCTAAMPPSPRINFPDPVYHVTPVETGGVLTTFHWSSVRSIHHYLYTKK